MPALPGAVDPVESASFPTEMEFELTDKVLGSGSYRYYCKMLPLTVQSSNPSQEHTN
jgi:hypothetical protein